MKWNLFSTPGINSWALLMCTSHVSSSNEKERKYPESRWTPFAFAQLSLYLDSARKILETQTKKIKILLNTANNFNVKTCTMCLCSSRRNDELAESSFIFRNIQKLPKNLARHFLALFLWASLLCCLKKMRSKKDTKRCAEFANFFHRR